jgi:hypothetical protein
MSQSKQVARLRAEEALQNVTGTESDRLMHLGEYTTSYAGDSISGVLGSQFVQHHGIGCGDAVEQFFDVKTGALVIFPGDCAPSPEHRLDGD